MNGAGIVPNFKTTSEQINKFVPYIEIISDDLHGMITGIRWKIVDPNDTSRAKPQNFRLVIKYASVLGWGIATQKINQNAIIEAGENPEGEIFFENENPVGVDFAPLITLEFVSYENSSPVNYAWNFINHEEGRAEIGSLGTGAKLPLRKGKPDYTRRYIDDMGINPGMAANFRINEAKYFTDAGRGTIPAGRYIVSEIGEDEIAKFESDTPITVQKIMDAENSYYIESASNISFPVLPSTRFGEPYLNFGAVLNLRAVQGESLSGRLIYFTFPEELNLYCEYIIPPYKLIDEQLATFYPYVEIVSSDGFITAINYRIIQNGNMETAINPNPEYDYTFSFSGYNYGTKSIGIPAGSFPSGTYIFDEPVSVKDLERIFFSINTRYEADENFAIRYGWDFMNELASGFVDAPGLGNETLNNIVNAIAGINDISELHEIEISEIGKLSLTTEEVRNFFERQQRAGVGRFNRIDVNNSGWYVMKITMTNELYDALNGQDVKDFQVYGLADTENNGDVNASIIYGLGIFAGGAVIFFVWRRVRDIIKS